MEKEEEEKRRNESRRKRNAVRSEEKEINVIGSWKLAGKC